ncbi:GSCFA domain-containing protein [Fibrella sp. HMF5335]|uniref:GSCFA domain-containing protein n=1 Tax=Fibrella rubiginis TaxID=2817060 RepID=A0A939GGS7_9BACT|nr:GSCFA domain-containing protein [Fibrella rubiginis]MBO0938862.1 GSCFA domain-containing protein [Fibrella rubiginis]
MLFHTELTPDELPVALQLTDRIVTIGSCFAEVMGQRLADSKLATAVNPLGTLFNPLSISKLLTLALTDGAPDELLYVERDGLWFHYDFHSSFWAKSRNELTDRLSGILVEVARALRKANWLLLTLGSAVVYRHKESGQVVANCHKMPQVNFDKFLCPINEVRDSLTQLLTLLRTHNPNLRVVLTVSPVRHVRDGLTLNGASKALLRTICAEVSLPASQTYYFPAYELVLDDLRDYRFYEADLIHPNVQAHDYVFGKFAESAFSQELRAFVKEWSQIRQGLAHRPLHGNTAAYRQFLTNLLAKIQALPAAIDTTTERAEVQSRLENKSNV